MSKRHISNDAENHRQARLAERRVENIAKKARFGLNPNTQSSAYAIKQAKKLAELTKAHADTTRAVRESEREGRNRPLSQAQKAPDIDPELVALLRASIKAPDLVHENTRPEQPVNPPKTQGLGRHPSPAWSDAPTQTALQLKRALQKAQAKQRHIGGLGAKLLAAVNETLAA